MFTVTWTNNEVQLMSIQELNDLLDALETQFNVLEPTLVAVELDRDGSSLAIGLGGDLSVLNYIDGSGNPPYFTSVGREQAEETLSFQFMGELSEFPMRNAIGVSKARRAMTEFVKTGSLPSCIEWEQD